MNMLSPKELTQSYSEMGAKKASYPTYKLILLSILAGATIAMGGVSSTIASYAVENSSIAKLIASVVFPCGLAIILLCGFELFTSNCLISIAVLDKKTTVSKMLRNWVIVYLGNGAGALGISAVYAYTGKFSSEKIAYYVVKTAVAKCSVTLPQALIWGILCNVLVSFAIFCAMSAKDTTGKVVGAFLPIVLFILCGFEHCIANLYYVPTALMLLPTLPADALGLIGHLDLSALNWGSFLIANLIPVTLGNIIGGVAMGAVMWGCHTRDGHKQHM